MPTPAPTQEPQSEPALEPDRSSQKGTDGTSFGTGLSLTFKYKSNFSWRIFCDYDYAKKTFTMKYDPYHFLKPGLTTQAYTLIDTFSDVSANLEPVQYRKEKKMNFFTIGGSFVINF
jgi:hypothetical protein